MRPPCPTELLLLAWPELPLQLIFDGKIKGITSSTIKPKSSQQSGVKETPVLHLSIPGSFSSPAGITRGVELSVDRGRFNKFGTREFSSVWGSAAIIVPLCVTNACPRCPCPKSGFTAGLPRPLGLAATPLSGGFVAPSVPCYGEDKAKV